MLFDKTRLEKYLASTGCFLSIVFILTILMQGRHPLQQ